MVCTSTCYFISLRTFYQSWNFSPVLELFISLGTFHQSCNISSVMEYFSSLETFHLSGTFHQSWNISPVWTISTVMEYFTCQEHFTCLGTFHQLGTFFHNILIHSLNAEFKRVFIFEKLKFWIWLLFHHNYWILIYTLTNWIIKLLYISFKLKF